MKCMIPTKPTIHTKIHSTLRLKSYTSDICKLRKVRHDFLTIKCRAVRHNRTSVGLSRVGGWVLTKYCHEYTSNTERFQRQLTWTRSLVFRSKIVIWKRWDRKLRKPVHHLSSRMPKCYPIHLPHFLPSSSSTFSPSWRNQLWIQSASA